MVKSCSKCLVILPIEMFDLKKHSNTKRRDKCNKCWGSKAAQWVYKNPDKVRIAHNKYKINGGIRKRRLKSIYSITELEYEEKLKNQNYKCAICFSSASQGNQSRLVIDHCHNTGIIRGLLCNNCNAGIGFFKDDINRMQEAIKYLISTMVTQDKGD